MADEEETPSSKVQSLINNYNGDYKNLEWMIRPCGLYSGEYVECRSIRGRFQQYFIYGETLDCGQWEKDHRNCKKWKKKQDEDAMEELIKSEMERRNKRLNDHYANDVWKDRTKPPEDWNKPLPEWLVKRDEVSYLAEMTSRLTEKDYAPIKFEESSCTIL